MIITQTAHSFTKTFVRYNGSSWVAALADVVANVATHFAYRIDANRFYLNTIKTLTSYSTITDDVGAALVANTIYYLSSTVAGKVTSTAPTIKQEVIRTIGTIAKINIVNYTNAQFDAAGSIDIPIGETYKIANTNLSATDIGLGNVTNNIQIKKATSSTIGKLVQWSGITGDTIIDGQSVTTSLGSPGVNTNIATEKSVRTAVGGASGNVVGPSSATDNAIALFNLTTGKLIKNSLAINNIGSISIPSTQTYKIANTNLSATDIGLGNVTDNAQLKINSNLSDLNDIQTALNNLTAVSSASDEYILTKDTGTGNAIFKVSSGGGLPAGTINQNVRYSGSAWEATSTILTVAGDGVHGKFYENTVATASSGATPTINWNNGGIQHIILTASTVTFTFTAPTGGSKYLKLIILQDATGGRFVVWPTSIKFDKGIPIALNLAPNGATILEMMWDGVSSYRMMTPTKLFQESFWDFTTLPAVAGGWFGAAITTGTSPISTGLVSGNRVHNGTLKLTSSTSANSGYRWTTSDGTTVANKNSVQTCGGDVFMACFSIQTGIAANFMMGFNDTISATAGTTDGIWVNIAVTYASPTTTYTITGNQDNAAGTVATSGGSNVFTSTAAAGTPIFVTVLIYTDYSYSNSYYKMYDDTGTLIWSDYIAATYLPGTTEKCTVLFQAIKVASGSATTVSYLDWVRVGKIIKFS
jgi:hypothetical protein